MSRRTKDLTNPWRAITLEELAEHNDVDSGNAWMAIKGIVYDVAEYASVHPGGIDKIKKYAGKDGTEAFNMIHSYVNVETILRDYQVAILKDHPEAPKKGFFKSLNCFNWSWMGGRYKHPTTYFRQDSIVGTYTVEFQHRSQECEWTVGVLEKKSLYIFKYIDNKKAWLSAYELPEEIYNDEIEVVYKNNFEHVDITIRKPLPTTSWAKQIHGLREAGRFVNINESHAKFDGCLVYKKCLTSNVIMFGVQIVDSARIGVPIGFCVNIHIEDIQRPYTPVCQFIVDDGSPKPIENGSTATVLFFMIRIYSNGKLTRALDEIELDEGNVVPTLKISTPYGYFDKEFIKDFSVMLLICGGTGLTPMVTIIKSYWSSKETVHGKRIGLIHFCHRDHDLIWRKQFEQMNSTSAWFCYFPVVTSPSPTCHWKGLTGRINTELIQGCLNEISTVITGIKKACICGPPGFNSASVDALAGVILAENIFVFSG